MKLHKRIHVIFCHSTQRKLDVGKLTLLKNTFILEGRSYLLTLLISHKERERERERETEVKIEIGSQKKT